MILRRITSTGRRRRSDPCGLMLITPSARGTHLRVSPEADCSDGGHAEGTSNVKVSVFLSTAHVIRVYVQDTDGFSEN